MQPGVTARCSSARVGVGKRGRVAKFSSVRVGVCEGVSIVARVAHRVAEDVLGAAKDGSVKVFIVAHDFAFWGPGGARPHRHATTTAAAVFAQLASC